MATVTLVEEAKAPAPPKPISHLTQVSREALSGLKKGKVAQITLEEGETTRGVKQSLARIAKQQGKKLALWEVDGAVYAKLI